MRYELVASIPATLEVHMDRDLGKRLCAEFNKQFEERLKKLRREDPIILNSSQLDGEDALA